jgi:hypothetical protein
MGGDDLSQLETGGYHDLNPEHYSGDFLFFTTFGPTAEGWRAIRESKHADTRPPGFFADYSAVQAERSARGVYRTPPNGHIMLAYDAVTVLLTAVEGYRDKHNGRLPTRTQISDELRDLRGYGGVAGVVSFADTDATPAPGGRDPADKLVVVQQVARDGAGVGSRFVTADGDL